jgi:hypothetical protein
VKKNFPNAFEKRLNAMNLLRILMALSAHPGPMSSPGEPRRKKARHTCEPLEFPNVRVVDADKLLSSPLPWWGTPDEIEPLWASPLAQSPHPARSSPGQSSVHSLASQPEGSLERWVDDLWVPLSLEDHTVVNIHRFLNLPLSSSNDLDPSVLEASLVVEEFGAALSLATKVVGFQSVHQVREKILEQLGPKAEWSHSPNRLREVAASSTYPHLALFLCLKMMSHSECIAFWNAQSGRYYEEVVKRTNFRVVDSGAAGRGLALAPDFDLIEEGPGRVLGILRGTLMLRDKYEATRDKYGADTYCFDTDHFGIVCDKVLVDEKDISGGILGLINDVHGRCCVDPECIAANVEYVETELISFHEFIGYGSYDPRSAVIACVLSNAYTPGAPLAAHYGSRFEW